MKRHRWFGHWGAKQHLGRSKSKFLAEDPWKVVRKPRVPTTGVLKDTHQEVHLPSANVDLATKMDFCVIKSFWACADIREEYYRGLDGYIPLTSSFRRDFKSL